MLIIIGYILLAAGISWAITKFLIWINNLYHICDYAVFSWAYDLIIEHGCSVREFVFWTLLVILLVSRLHLTIARIIGYLILIAVVIILGILLWQLLMWIVSLIAHSL